MRHIVLFFCFIFIVAQAAESTVVLPKPSANAGKSGTYQVQTGVAGYSYFVSVPPKMPDDSHYGLHLFFHGQNGQSGASWFALWQDKFIYTYGLIAINMCYADGDNAKDTAGKVAVAKAATLQVMADYPVVPGRGMIACFSGGGMPCGLWYSECARKRGLAWPFTAQALYSANFQTSIEQIGSTGWYVGVNTDEWTLAGLGSSQTARYAEALALFSKACPDHRLLVVNHVGHTIPPQGPVEAASLFRRIDLAYAPFLHEGSYPAKLAPIIAAANTGQLAAAVATMDKSKKDPAITTQTTELRTRIEARMDAQIVLIANLSASDPLLATWYGNVFLKGLKGHKREAELKTTLAVLAKENKAVPAANVLEAFSKGFSGVFDGGPIISKQGLPLLERLAQSCGEKSMYGMIATELLALPHVKTP